MSKRITVPAALLLITAFLFMAALPAAAADDVTGHWAEKDMRFLIDRGILQGDNTGYHPNKVITRGQFAVLLARSLKLEEAPGNITFTDVDNRSGYLAELLAAANAGIIDGYPDGTFRPSDKIKRQHMAVMMKRAMDYLKLEGKKPGYKFADENEMLPSYRAMVYDLAGAGIFTGSEQPDGSYLFRPMNEAHRWEAATVITRLIKVVEKIEDEEVPSPSPSPQMDYATAVIDSKGNHTTLRKFKSFDEASAALASGQVVLYKDSIVKMQSGVVITKPALTGSTLTNVYEKPDFKSAFTYVTSDSELEYLESTPNYVKVRIAGKDGYIKHENAELKTWNMLKGRSYYTADSAGNLVHYIFSNRTGGYLSYSTGKAPEGMTPGAKYTSWDQVHFVDANGKSALTNYNYYQFLPARTKTVYSATDIDAYVAKKLKALEGTKSAAYKDATKKSKLIGIGKALKKVEEEKGINALMILALAQHESNYGMSDKAQLYNNLFGLAVYDDLDKDHKFHKYRSIEENVNTLADRYWNKNYIPPTGPYANGAAFGTKAVGFNVKYASDPYWGAKAAGHAYRADKEMGGRDYGRYTIGLTTADNLKARTSPEIGNNIQFAYKKSGMPVVIIGSNYNEAEKINWQNILSDDRGRYSVHVAGQYVDVIHKP
ncbi:S-layer homology domain-containing protein [Bhargavaea cecembensis]|uniref:S-layer homology domain-containing protein n=1 Tax=Bhargavaea cecembensis TaxID=394098 RepID=UPI00117745B4|nr:S-layer homology domain-containing protein [Bhargavaea cecembensis]